jgi:formate/nitrite transporter FocA (FNT family)
MKEKLKIFPAAILAGCTIGIGGTLFLSVDNKIIGSLMFSVGLYIICAHGLYLYTGKVGYVTDMPLDYLVDLVITWVGNFIGTILMAALVGVTRISGIWEKAADMCDAKSADTYESLFLLGVACGFLMYAAVEGYKQNKNPILLYACVSAFILCGFEHCIADMFYFALAGRLDGDTILRLLVITAGNSLGGICIPLGRKILES